MISAHILFLDDCLATNYATTGRNHSIHFWAASQSIRLADPKVFGSDPLYRPNNLPDDPAPLNRIITAMARDALVPQAEIARLSFRQLPIRGSSLAVPWRNCRAKPSSSSWCSKRWRLARPTGSLRHRRPWAAAGVWWMGNSMRFSAICFCQIDPLSRPEDDPLSGLDIP